MRKLENITLFAGLAFALLNAYIGLLLLNTLNWPYMHLEHGKFIVYMFLFVYAFANPLMITRDMRWFWSEKGDEAAHMQAWDDHWGHKLTLFVLRRKVLLYITLIIPLIFFVLRILVSIAYHITDVIITPVIDWFRDVFDWIADKFDDFKWAIGWY